MTLKEWERERNLAADGLITSEHLERHLPDELPFRGRTLKLTHIKSRTKEHRLQYFVGYSCDDFFSCAPPVRPWYPKAKIAVSSFIEEDPPLHEDLGGFMFIDRVPPERLQKVLRTQLRKMYWSLTLKELERERILAADGLITSIDLKRHLPDELPFRGRTLKLTHILPLNEHFKSAFITKVVDDSGTVVSKKRGATGKYSVGYSCENFFNCTPPVRPWYPMAKKAMEFGEFALFLLDDAAAHEDLGGFMFIDRVPPERLQEVLRDHLRMMYRQLEHHVKEELEIGCLIR